MLSLDIGTTKICLMELNDENSVLDTKVVDNKGTTIDDGFCHEQDADVIFGQVQALLKGKEKDHLALTGQMHGFVLIDKEGNAQSPCITWRDQRIKGMHLPGDPERTGCKIHRGYAAGTLVWMQKQGQDLKGLRAVSLPGYIQGKLTGDFSIRSPSRDHPQRQHRRPWRKAGRPRSGGGQPGKCLVCDPGWRGGRPEPG